MKYSFVCYGGSGSTWLTKRLARKFRHIHQRPETYWLPHYFPKQSKSATAYDQQLTEAGYDDKPTLASAAGFAKRTQSFGCRMGRPIRDSLLHYWEFMQKRSDAVTMFSRAPMLGFFQQCATHMPRDSVIFVVRHPLHQYISLTKANRHFEFVANTGGINSPESIKFWVTEWTRYVRDALASGFPIVRYEYAAEDRQQLPDAAAEIFAKWDGSRRNNGVLRTEFEDQLKVAVWDEYKEVYGSSWTV